MTRQTSGDTAPEPLTRLTRRPVPSEQAATAEATVNRKAAGNPSGARAASHRAVKSRSRAASSTPTAISHGQGPTTARSSPPASRPTGPSRTRRSPAGSPAAAFDALHAAHTPDLVRQTFLLTGHLPHAHRAVEYAFRLAWQRWPEVARDGDPAGWVRAAAYEHALSPWHRFRPGHRPRRDAEAHHPVLTALLALPPSYRRALVLHDGLGLGLPETAAEVEASTPATASRVANARAAMADLLPGLQGLPPGRLSERLGGLLWERATAPVVRVRPARVVRAGSERRTRLRTGAALGATALLAATLASAVVASPSDRGRATTPAAPAVTASPAARPHQGGQAVAAAGKPRPADGPARHLAAGASPGPGPAVGRRAESGGPAPSRTGTGHRRAASGHAGDRVHPGRSKAPKHTRAARHPARPGDTRLAPETR